MERWLKDGCICGCFWIDGQTELSLLPYLNATSCFIVALQLPNIVIFSSYEKGKQEQKNSDVDKVINTFESLINIFNEYKSTLRFKPTRANQSFHLTCGSFDELKMAFCEQIKVKVLYVKSVIEEVVERLESRHLWSQKYV